MPDMRGPKKTTPEVASPASTPAVPTGPGAVPPVQSQNPPQAVGAASVKDYGTSVFGGVGGACAVDEVIGLLGGFGRDGQNPSLDAFEKISGFLHGLRQYRIALPAEWQARLDELVGAEDPYAPQRGALSEPLRANVEDFYAAATANVAWGEDMVLTRAALATRLEMARFCGTADDIAFWTEHARSFEGDEGGQE